MQLGKFDSDRDSALHYLCTVEWSNDSTGDVEAPTGYVWRISLTSDDVFGCFGQGNMEFDSVLQEWEQQNIDVEDYDSFRRSLVGHFLVWEDSNGLVGVHEYTGQDAESQLVTEFEAIQKQYSEWLDANEDV